MTWFKVDDGLHSHPKVFQAGTAALGLWVRAGSWCADQLTDGFVPDYVAKMYGTPAMAKALVSAGLWVKVNDGFQFHQWNEEGRQPTRAHVESEREAARERMRRRREESQKKRSGSADVRANTDRTSEGVRGPRPDPTRPEGSYGPPGGQLGSSGGTSVTRGSTPAAELVERFSAKCREFGYAPVAHHATLVGNDVRDLLAEGNSIELVTIAVDLAAAEGKPLVASKMGPAVGVQRQHDSAKVSPNDPVWGATLGRQS